MVYVDVVLVLSDWNHHVTFSETPKQGFAYTSNIVLHVCWPVPSHHGSLVSDSTSYFILVYHTANCISFWCLLPLEFPLKLSVHCHKTTHSLHDAGYFLKSWQSLSLSSNSLLSLWNLKVHYCAYKSLPLDPILNLSLSQLNAVYSIDPLSP
jgi:hypothetical protein